MYFWKYKKLALELRNNAVTPKQYRIYQVIFWIGVLFSLPALLVPVYVIIVVGAWLWITYAVNKRGDAKDYFKRLVCLDLPVTIRTCALGIVLAFPTGVVAGILSQGATADSEVLRVSMLVINAIISIYYIVIYVKGFKIASGQSDT